MKRKFGFIIVCGFILAIAITVFNKVQPEQVVLPNPQNHNNFNPPPQSPNSPTPPPTAVPAELNLAIPFTSQAPHANWEDPYGDFCEEASALMAAYFIQDKKIPNANFANEELLKIMDYEVTKFGYHKDTTAAETKVILEDYFKVPTKLMDNPTVEQIKQQLSLGKAIIIPAAGRQLPNPNFRSPGPLYHMLVIKGFTKDGKFITNDPGTRNGANFLYNYNDLMNAIHDWNHGDVDNGKKVALVVG